MTICLASPSQLFFLNHQGQPGAAVSESMDPQNIPTREESAADPINPPRVSQYRGSDYLDPMCVALGLDSRAELRRLQDYLADLDQSVHPVSETGRYRFITGRHERKQVVPEGKQVAVIVPILHFCLNGLLCTVFPIFREDCLI